MVLIASVPGLCILFTFIIRVLVLSGPKKSPRTSIYCSYSSSPQGLFATIFHYSCPLIPFQFDTVLNCIRHRFEVWVFFQNIPSIRGNLHLQYLHCLITGMNVALFLTVSIHYTYTNMTIKNKLRITISPLR